MYRCIDGCMDVCNICMYLYTYVCVTYVKFQLKSVDQSIDKNNQNTFFVFDCQYSLSKTTSSMATRQLSRQDYP